jgi:chemotaxis protein histidine kinase CheA
MSQRSRDFEQALRRLRAEYRAELPARLEALEAKLARARMDGTADALRDARRLAHTLKGTSGSYGLDGVSKALEAAEEALDELLSGAEDSAQTWGAVSAALEHARRQIAG